MFPCYQKIQQFLTVSHVSLTSFPLLIQMFSLRVLTDRRGRLVLFSFFLFSFLFLVLSHHFYSCVQTFLSTCSFHRASISLPENAKNQSRISLLNFINFIDKQVVKIMFKCQVIWQSEKAPINIASVI